MARPIKEGMDYFPHDVDASNDEKIEMLTSIYGNDGYAFYFIMLERIYRSKDFLIDISDSETKEEMFQILSSKTRLTVEQFTKILNTSLKYGLFDKRLYEEQGYITSDGIKKRSNQVITKREMMKERYNSRKKNNISVAETKEETISETQQSKEKKSKEKKSKEKKSKEDDECCCDSDFNIFKYLELRGFIGLSAIVIQQIQSDMELYSVAEVKNAIDIADDNGKHSYSYVRGILERRRAQGDEKKNYILENNEIVKKSIETGEDPF